MATSGFVTAKHAKMYEKWNSYRNIMNSTLFCFKCELNMLKMNLKIENLVLA